MGLRINTNVQSIQAQNSLGKVTRSKSKTLNRLATGSRINQAADDAAGLAISEKMKGTIRSSRQATRNANDGISMVQTAEGGLSEVSNILVRLRELSVQSASDTIGNEERQFTDLEYQSLVSEVDRISQSTEFNGTSLLTGGDEKLDFQIGVNNNEFQDRISMNLADNNTSAESIGIAETGIGSKESAQNNLENIDTAMQSINANRANLGALQNRLQKTVSNLEVKTENLSAANSRIRDADIAIESSMLAKQNVLTQASSSVLAQANQQAAVALKLIG